MRDPEKEALKKIIRTLIDDSPAAEKLIATTRRTGARPPAPKKFDPKWKKTLRVCPHCGDEKPVIPDFGVRVVRDVERPQPWCRKCRNTTNYHNAPRKNRSKHNPGG